jgi:hypothetical protein
VMMITMMTIIIIILIIVIIIIIIIIPVSCILRAHVEKLVVIYLVKKYFYFVESERSFPCSHQPDPGP